MRDLVNNITPNAPCKGCDKRYLGCHSKCKEYIEFKEKSEVARKTVADKKTFEFMFYSGKRKVWTKTLKQKKGK